MLARIGETSTLMARMRRPGCAVTVGTALAQPEAQEPRERQAPARRVKTTST